MLKIPFQKSGLLALIIAGILASAPALADKPDWAGGGKGGKSAQRHEPGYDKNRQDQDWPAYHHDQAGVTPGRYFDDQQRALVQDYYAGQLRAGNCPPGLAKKHNGCLPPGQAKKWAMGQPLPPDVVYYDLPYSVSRQFGMPPPGYRYVRVANDILLITTGTRMVVDAIRDLGGM